MCHAHVLRERDWRGRQKRDWRGRQKRVNVSVKYGKSARIRVAHTMPFSFRAPRSCTPVSLLLTKKVTKAAKAATPTNTPITMPAVEEFEDDEDVFRSCSWSRGDGGWDDVVSGLALALVVLGTIGRVVAGLILAAVDAPAVEVAPPAVLFVGGTAMVPAVVVEAAVVANASVVGFLPVVVDAADVAGGLPVVVGAVVVTAAFVTVVVAPAGRVVGMSLVTRMAGCVVALPNNSLKRLLQPSFPPLTHPCHLMHSP